MVIPTLDDDVEVEVCNMKHAIDLKQCEIYILWQKQIAFIPFAPSTSPEKN